MTKPSSVAASALLSPFASSVLELYAEALPDVRFPDLDLAALEALVEEVRDAQEEVDRAESELQDAKERLAARGAALHARAERALSYARIYADGNPELSARVDAVRKQPGENTESAPKKRGRPRKGHEGQLDVLDVAAE
jgi:hypothetical protein